MDSLGDYIYLIILAIAGLSGLLKKKKNPTKSATPSTTKRSWEDVLRELTPIDEEEEIEEKYEEPVFKKVEPVKLEPAMVVNYETIADSTQSRAKRNPSTISSSNKSKKEQKIPLLEIPPSSEYSLNSPEEARRAFVYSEIFNRKY